MADYLRLIEKGASSVGLSDELELIQALVAMAENWAELAEKITGAGSLEELVDTVAKDVDDTKVKTAFEELGLAKAHDSLSRLLVKITAGADKIPDKYKKLFEPLSKYETEGGGLVAWSLSGEKEAPIGNKVKLGIKGEVAFHLDAAAKAKIGEAELQSPLLQIGVGAGVKANATGELPIRWGKISASAEASVDVALDYYYDPGTSTALYVAAVAERIVELPDPFDYASVWEAFQSPRNLAGITYHFNDKAKAKVDVALGASGEFADKVIAEATLGIGASVAIDNQFQVSLRGLPKLGASRPFEIVLTRGSDKDVGIGVDIGVKVDFDASVVRLREILNKAVAKSDEILGEIAPYLTPGTWLRERFGTEVDAAAKKLLGDPALAGLRDALVKDLQSLTGVAEPSESALVAFVRDKLTGAIDDGAKQLTELGDKARDAILDRVTKALPAPLGAEAGSAIREKVDEALAALVETVSTAFETKLGELIAKPGDKLVEALKSANIAVGDKLDTLDDALAPVRELIDHYNELLHKVHAVANDTARTRIAAKIRFEESWKWGSEEKIIGTFDAPTAEAEKVFDQITRGDAETLKALLLDVIDGKHAKVPGFTLGGGSHIKRTAGRTSVAGFELVALGFGEEGSVELDGNASVLIDADGKVQVGAEGSLKKRFKTAKATREVTFVDTFSMLVAKSAAATGGPKPVIDAGVGISHVDKSLKLKELRRFVSSLSAAGLVSADTVGAAEALFLTWSPEGKAMTADVAAKLELSHDQVRKLMLLDQRDTETGQLTNSGKRKLIATAVAAAESIDANRKDVNQGARDIVLSFPGMKEKPLPDFLLDRVNEAGTNNDFTKQIDGKETDTDIKAIVAEYKRMLGLVGLVQRLGDIYLATPQIAGPPIPGAWSVQRYARMEHLVANDSTRWLQTGGGFWQISDEVPTVTVIFLATVCDLVGIKRLEDDKPRPEGIDAMALSLSRRTPDGNSIAEKRYLTLVAAADIP